MRSSGRRLQRKQVRTFPPDDLLFLSTDFALFHDTMCMFN